MDDERNVLRSEISSLLRYLEGSDGVVKRLETTYGPSRLHLQCVTMELDGIRSELEELQAHFAAEIQRSAAAVDALGEANGRAQRMEEEIAIMEAAKMADEEAVQRVSARYSKLRELHVGCLAEMDGLVGVVRERKRG